MWKNLQQNNFALLTIYSLFVLSIACIYTYPLITDLNNIVYGFSGDNFGGIWQSWWLKYASANNLGTDVTPLMNFPFGEDISSRTAEYLWLWPMQGLSFLTNEIFAFNFLMLMSFPLSALSMYFLIYYLTRDRLVSMFGGLVFGLMPFHMWQGYSHLSLALTQWLPLGVLSLFYFDRERSAKSSFFMGISLFLITMTTFYYGYFMVITAVCFFLGRTIYDLIFKKTWYWDIETIKKLLLSGLIFSLLMSPFLYRWFNTKSVYANIQVVQRPISDLLSLSMRPWDFVLPAPNHFLFGSVGQGFYESSIKPLTNDYKSISSYIPERVLFIGFSTLLLAAVGIFLLRKKESRSIIALALFLLIILTLLSAPAFIIVKGVTIYFPSYYLYEYVPYIRAYVRAGVFVNLFLIVLASFGLQSLISKQKLRARAIVTIIFAALIIFEFAPRLGTSTTDLRGVTKAYEWLSTQEGTDSIVEYPHTFDIADALIMQTRHAKGFLNPYKENKRDLFNEIKDPRDPLTHRILSALGIDYMVVHTQPLYGMDHPIDGLDFTRYMKLNPAEVPLELVFEDKGVYVFEVPKYNTDLAGAIFLKEEGFRWVVSERGLKPGSSNIYLGNFTNNILRATLNLEGAELDSRELELEKGWNTIPIATKQNTHLKAELNNIE